MNPWNILGWLFVIAVAIPTLIVTLSVLAGLWKIVIIGLTHMFKRWASSKVPPKEGQRWKHGDAILSITKIRDDGTIVIRTANSSWCEDLASWEKRVKNRGLILISQPKEDSKIS